MMNSFVKLFPVMFGRRWSNQSNDRIHPNAPWPLISGKSWEVLRHLLVLADQLASVLVNAQTGTKVQGRALGTAAQLADRKDVALTIFDVGTGFAEVWLPVVTGDEGGKHANGKSGSDVEHLHGGWLVV